jgi:hypothetical protein
LGFGAWTFGHDLPVALCNPLHFEGHAGRFFHVPNMALFGIFDHPPTLIDAGKPATGT